MPVINKRSVLKEKRPKLKDKNRKVMRMMCGHNDCIYASTMCGGMCDYLDIEGHSRGCKPTKDCKRYKSGILNKRKKLEL